MHVMLEQLVPAAVMGICGFVVWFLKRLATSIEDLSQQMAVYVERVTTILDHLEDHEARLRSLESDNRSIN